MSNKNINQAGLSHGMKKAANQNDLMNKGNSENKKSIDDLLSPLNIFRKNLKAIQNYKYNKKVGSYLIGDCLGKGSFAKVNEALHTITGEKVAIKVIDKSRCSIDAYVRRTLRREGRLLQQLKHPNLIQLLEILETEHAYYLALELCPGEGLLGKIGTEGKLSENTARRYLKQLISGVTYMHNQGVIHRDLKVENILLSENDQIKIIDFGLSTQIREPGHYNRSKVEKGEVDGCQGICKTQCGSPAYAAPEVLSKKPYGMQADVWSIGVNLFAMIAGLLPFSVRPFSISALCQKMLLRDMNPLPPGISSSCTDLINRLLDPNPQTRIRLHEARKHVWLKQPKGLNDAKKNQTPSFMKPKIQVENLSDHSDDESVDMIMNMSENAENLLYPDCLSLNNEFSDGKEPCRDDIICHSPILVTTLSRWILESFPNLSITISKSNITSATLPQKGDAKEKESLVEFVRHVISNTPGPYVTVYHLLIAKTRRYCRKYNITFREWLMKVFKLNQTRKYQSNYLESRFCLSKSDGNQTMNNCYGSRDRLGHDVDFNSKKSYTAKKYQFDKNFNNLFNVTRDRNNLSPSVTELSNLTTDSSIAVNAQLFRDKAEKFFSTDLQRSDIWASTKTLASSTSNNNNNNCTSHNIMALLNNNRNINDYTGRLMDTSPSSKNPLNGSSNHSSGQSLNKILHKNYTMHSTKNSLSMNQSQHISSNNLLPTKIVKDHRTSKKLDTRIPTNIKHSAQIIPTKKDGPRNQSISKSSNCVIIQPFQNNSNNINPSSSNNSLSQTSSQIKTSHNDFKFSNTNLSSKNKPSSSVQQFRTMPSNRSNYDELNTSLENKRSNITDKINCFDFERILKNKKRSENTRLKSSNSKLNDFDGAEQTSPFVDISHMNTVSGANGLLNKWRNMEQNNLNKTFQNKSRTNLENTSNQRIKSSWRNLAKTSLEKEFLPYSLKRGEIKDHGRQTFQPFIDSSTISSLSNKSDQSISKMPSSVNDIPHHLNNNFDSSQKAITNNNLEKPLTKQPGRVQIIKIIG